MFTLIKIIFELLLALGLFYGGMKFQQKYPGFITRVESILSWVKKILPSAPAAK